MPVPDTEIDLEGMSLNPPHLIDSQGRLLPSSFIPLCAYQTSMSIPGQNNHNLDFTACSSFQPALYQGQLCYSLNISRVTKNKSKPDKKHGLFFVIDPNIIEQKDTEDYKVVWNKKDNLLPTKDFDPNTMFPRIHIQTLAQFTSHKEGTFAITGLKKMFGSDSFLELPDDIKNCQIETFEQCHAKRLKDQVLEQCGCVRWDLDEENVPKVNFCT